jgi:hypothetical protein
MKPATRHISIRQVELTPEATGNRLRGVKRRVVKVLVLLWLGWYLSGPLAETVDFWDTPREEWADMIRTAGGLVALLGAAIVVGVSRYRSFRERLRLVSRQTLSRAFYSKELLLDSPASFLFFPTHSPPLTLRV